VSEADDVQRIAVMPDVHLAGDVCVGVVLATSTLLYPAAVGSDIGCGMAAIGFDANADVLENETAAATLLADLYRYVPANRHHRETMTGSHRDEYFFYTSVRMSVKRIIEAFVGYRHSVANRTTESMIS
jgi:RNA-splicing ligase RtcB